MSFDIWARSKHSKSAELTEDEAVKLLVGIIIQEAQDFFGDDEIDKDTRMYNLAHSQDELQAFGQCFPRFSYRMKLSDSVTDIAKGFVGVQ